jgi:hypothetical protein
MRRHEQSESGLDLLAQPPQRLAYMEERRAGMVTYLALLIKRMANLAEENTKISQTGKATAKERGLPQIALAIPAEPLHYLKTRGHFKQGAPFKIKPLDLGSSQEWRHIRNRCKGRSCISGEQGDEF